MKTILVRRNGALGDVVLATPIVRRLKKENPNAIIYVETYSSYLSVFKGPNTGASDGMYGTLLRAAGSSPAVEYYDKIINLNLAYEKRPNMHIVEAYMVEAFGEKDADCLDMDFRQELFFDRTTLPNIKGKGYIAVHAAVAGWANRTLPRDTWKEVLHRLGVAGLRPILVGTERDAAPGFDCPSFLIPDIHAQARLIQSCECFIGSDSGLLHVAGCTDTPIVGVFTCASPENRLPFREKCVAVAPPGLDCLGCLHRRDAPVTTEHCERGDNACVRDVRATDIVDAVLKLIL
jgi:ADP-heptose:LPS heptosyltransferase